MIYLFCNEAYGKPILESTLRYARAIRVPITIVMSARRWRKRDLAGRALLVLSTAGHLLSKLWREKSLSQQYGSRVILTRNVNAWWFRRRINPEDHGIVSGFNQIFHPAAIARFRTLVNFHPSILPFYRGPVPSYWVIRNEEQRSGYTLHRITSRIDDGEILHQEDVPVDGCTTPDALNRRIATRAAELVPRYLNHLTTQSEWLRVELDGGAIYSTHVSYLSFPEKEQARSGS